jgi:hypothetical protein
LSGKRTLGSGNQWHSKGDVVTEKFLVEAKATFNQSIKVTATVWEKIRHEAFVRGKIPMMSLQFASSLGESRTDKHELVVLSMSDLIELLHNSQE